MKKIILCGAVAATLSACATGPSQTGDKPITYNNTIKQIMADRCMKCHGPDAPLIADFDKNKEKFKEQDIGPRMDTHANVMTFINGSDAGALMRRLDDGKNTKDGKPGNMYVKLSADDAERAARLELFKKWIGPWNLKKRPDWTAEDLAAVKAPKD